VSGPGFTGLALDRADRLRQQAEQILELATAAESRLLRMSGLEPHFSPEGGLEWTEPGPVAVEELLFLGLHEERALFAPLPRFEAGTRMPPTIFATLSEMAPQDASLWGMTISLINWHGRHGFCSNCGEATKVIRAGWARQCGGCGAEHFPRVDPVVIMLAEHEGNILVGRQRTFPPRRYSALAGFVEPGESIEEAVARELAEEAGVQATDVRYLASQPWPFPGQLMIACLARAASHRIILDPAELEDAIWVDRAGVAAALAGEESAPFLPPPRIAIAHTLLSRWLAEG
jgi:NAD+ diphosphatase